MKMIKESVEREMRFLLSSGQYNSFKDNIIQHRELFHAGNVLLETTIMYDNPNPILSFYSKEIDGRLRLRTSKPGKPDIIESSNSHLMSMLTWKQRIPELSNSDIRFEKEIEIHIAESEVDAMEAILAKILRCPRISSYERNRETLFTESIEIASDTFPYGHVVELELKNEDGNIDLLNQLAIVLGLNNTTVSRLSCDDLYRLLCKKSNIESRSDILFSDPTMPSLDDWLPIEMSELI